MLQFGNYLITIILTMKILKKHIKLIIIFALLNICLVVFWPDVRSMFPIERENNKSKTEIQIDDTNIGQFRERASAGHSSKRTINSLSKTERADSRSTQTGTIAKNVATASADAVAMRCQLSISFAPESKIIAPGSVIKYKINLKNIGGETCQNTSFSIYYDDNETFNSSVPKATAGGYYWEAGDLLSGEEYWVYLSTVHNKNAGSNQITNESCATAYNGADACANNLIFAQSDAAGASSFDQASFNKKEFGTWVWDSPKNMNNNYVAELLNAASVNGINALYITIDDYLDIAVLPDGKEKEQAKKEYFDALNRVITAAKARNIEVDAEGGAKDWIIADNRWKGYALIDFVKEYNQKYPNSKVRNFQYDVEPYLLSSYEQNKSMILKSFVEFVDESASIMQDVDAGFSIVVPHFYDSEQKWTPTVTYNGETNYVFSHLLNILEKKQGSAIIIMAYRNFFYGNNSTSQISEVEIKVASKKSFNTKIIVAQETGNVYPDYVTFYGLPRGEFFNALSSINNTFSSYGAFGGVAVHYIDSFLALKD